MLIICLSFVINLYIIIYITYMCALQKLDEMLFVLIYILLDLDIGLPVRILLALS